MTDICKRWIDKKFKTMFREQDLFSKQRCRKENKLIGKKINVLFAIWTCAVSNSTGPQNDKIPYLDIAIKKEHPFV